MIPETLAPPLFEALSKRGYESLTPVQEAVIAADAHGQDLIVSAQTGSGKTVAFGLALAEQFERFLTLPAYGLLLQRERG